MQFLQMILGSVWMGRIGKGADCTAVSAWYAPLMRDSEKQNCHHKGSISLREAFLLFLIHFV